MPYSDMGRPCIVPVHRQWPISRANVEKAEPARPTGAVDLMEALRASIERARSPKDSGEKASASKATGRSKKPAAPPTLPQLGRFGP
ncbi:hypothetical protein GCM10009731_52940 [Streptomyces globosus]